MKFEVLAHTTEPNRFGKYEYILGFDHGQAWTAKSGTPLPIGTALDLYGDAGSSTLYMGVNWARHGFEAAIPYRPEPKREPAPCSHGAAHFVLHLFRGDSVRPIQVPANRKNHILNAIRQQWSVFGMRYDRYELGEWQGSRFVTLRRGEIHSCGIGKERIFQL